VHPSATLRNLLLDSSVGRYLRLVDTVGLQDVGETVYGALREAGDAYHGKDGGKTTKGKKKR
jgi:hypothetical protein